MSKLIQLVNRSLIISTERLTLNPSSQFPRFLSSTNVVFDSKANVIARRLGIPERPKKPLSAFMRFLQEIRPSIQASTKLPREVPRIASTQWKKLDANQKQKYVAEFEKENDTYLKQAAAYEKSLTKEQKLALKDERIRLKEQSEQRAQNLERKTRLKELGKPKRPMSAFLLFYAELASKTKTSPKEVKVKYDSLNESQKNAYKQKAAALAEEYRKSLLTWQKKMVSKGLTDVIGYKTAAKLVKNK